MADIRMSPQAIDSLEPFMIFILDTSTATLYKSLPVRRAGHHIEGHLETESTTYGDIRSTHQERIESWLDEFSHLAQLKRFK
ncbi:hypothetical protein E4U58_002275 [Claviceps cyperi]|nr:hypothetical protein E4U58_002275 [Claviceps cyperi]